MLITITAIIGSFIGTCIAEFVFSRFKAKHRVTVIEQNHPDAPHVVADQVRASFGVST